MSNLSRPSLPRPPSTTPAIKRSISPLLSSSSLMSTPVHATNTSTTTSSNSTAAAATRTIGRFRLPPSRAATAVGITTDTESATASNLEATIAAATTAVTTTGTDGETTLEITAPSDKFRKDHCSPFAAMSMEDQSNLVLATKNDDCNETTISNQPFRKQTSVEPNDATEPDDHDAQVQDSAWNELVDSASGNIYYYNAMTGETSWERPVVIEEKLIAKFSDGEDLVASKAIEQQQADSLPAEIHIQPEMTALMSNDDRQSVVNVSTAPLKYINGASDWSEAVYEATGQTYYYNTVTLETSWERPSLHNKAIEKAAAMTGSVDPDVFVDLDTPPELTLPEREGELTTTNAYENYELSKRADEYQLPRGWMVELDEATGRTYYVHQMTMETTWDRPLTVQCVPEDALINETANDKRPEEVIQHPARGTMLTMEAMCDTAPLSLSATADEVSMYDNGVPESAGHERPLAAFKHNAVEASSVLDEWTELLHGSNGELHVCNQATGETVWDRRESVSNDTQQLLVNADTGPENVPETFVDSATYETEIEKLNFDDGEATGPSEAEETCDWIEELEEASGRTYYYNTKTGETTWTRIGADVSASEAPMEYVEDADIRNGAEFNAGNSNEGLLSEESQSEMVSLKQTLVEIASNDMPSLEWVARVDESTGKPYYLNIMARATAWELPEITDVPATFPEGDKGGLPVDAIAEPIALTVKNSTYGQNLDESGVDEQLGQVGGGLSDWVEGVDELTGQPYIVDKKRSEHTLGCHDASERGEGIDAGLVNHDESAVARSDYPLPQSMWSEMIEPSTGYSFYVNSVTGETKWERPVEFDSRRMAGPLKSSAVQNTLLCASQAAAPNDLAKSIADDSSLATDNNIDLVSKQNECNTKVSDDQKDTLTESERSMVELERNTKESVRPLTLPDGWEELIDHNTGSVYYFCAERSITSWERPISYADVDESDAMVDQPEVTGCQACIPFSWEEVADGQGCIYYFNAETNETSWMLPTDSIVTNEATRVGIEDNDEDHPHASEPPVAFQDANDEYNMVNNERADEWSEAVDPISGKMYFFNAVTGETSWDPPCPDTGSPNGNVAVTIESEQTESPVMSVGTAGDASLIQRHNLPRSWSELRDGEGRVYYFNEETSETTWEFPKLADCAADKVLPNGAKPMVDEKSQDGSARNHSQTPVNSTSRRFGSIVAKFGFGGRLLVSARGSLMIYKTSEVVPSDMILKIESSKRANNVIGCLVSADASDVAAYVNSQSETDHDILWRLVSIATETNGTLRVDDKSFNLEPLLLHYLRASLDHDGRTNVSAHEVLNKIKFESGNLHKVLELLISGHAEKAAEEAFLEGNHAISLIIAHGCGTQVFQKALEKFGTNGLLEGCTLHIYTMMLSQQISDPAKVNWGDNVELLCTTWKQTLAVILSNRVKGWDVFALSLADQLHAVGNVAAAHFCYLISGVSLASPARKGGKMSLIGCGLTHPMDLALATKSSIMAFARTEAYEWARRQGNSTYVCSSLQPLKLVYAVLLADYGFEEAALSYARSIVDCIGAAGNDFDGATNTVPLWLSCLGVDRNHTLVSLAEFMQRLERRVAPANESITSDNKKDATGFPDHTLYAERSDKCLPPAPLLMKPNERAERAPATRQQRPSLLQTRDLQSISPTHKRDVPATPESHQSVGQMPPTMLPLRETISSLTRAQSSSKTDTLEAILPKMKVAGSAPELQYQQTRSSQLGDSIEKKQALNPPSAPPTHPTTPTGQMVAQPAQQEIIKPIKSAPLSAPAHLEGRSKF
ncbi:hypothetical protein MPSEU_000526700 [Mayamaea pseudoterrestris]|nr:hypothetical protein MPSEU_000526700 [Mayamaea pseudoterrestris]